MFRTIADTISNTPSSGSGSRHIRPYTRAIDPLGSTVIEIDNVRCTVLVDHNNPFLCPRVREIEHVIRILG